VVWGLIYVLIGVFGAVVTGLLTAFPKELVAAIAGLALLGTIGSGVDRALARTAPRGRADHLPGHAQRGGIAGVGSAFWGVVAGHWRCW
jgi:benzoate membrane transport protein